MRVSQMFDLGRTQATLDFVDVDVIEDTPLFVSPRALEAVPSEWGDHCVYLVQNFFSRVLELIKSGDDREAEKLLLTLREPNETHLGLSRGESKGRALGDRSAHNVWLALTHSKAAKSGLLKDLEETALMIPGISVDIVSDITTNIIRAPLISYTQEVCHQYDIPMTDGVRSGPLWNPERKRWENEFATMPIASGFRLVLVPKVIVRQQLEYDPGEYYRHFLLEHLKQVELSANSGLVEVLKNGKRRVTKKSLIEKYGNTKEDLVRESLKYPHVLAHYKKVKDDKPRPPMSHENIANAEKVEGPDWDMLLSAVIGTKTGAVGADEYEKNIEALLTALFYPQLTNPKPQHKLHEGRKRVDITYTNMGVVGFFAWLAKHHPSSHIFIECKNYGKELGNPELDQLLGRFSPSRGKVGFIVCRKFEDKTLFLRRCKDAVGDGQGFVLPLDDKDLRDLVEHRKATLLFERWPLLADRFRDIVS